MKTSPFPLRARWKWLTRMIAVCVAATLSAGLTPGLASADTLDDQRKKVRGQISQTSQKVSAAQKKAKAAAAALAESRQQLAAAKTRLEYVQQQLQQARAKEAEMQAKLVVAQRELESAAAEVSRGEAEVAAQQALIGSAVRGAYQQKTDLAGISMVMTAQDTTEFANRLQWNTTIFDTTAHHLDVLQTLQLQLEAAKQRKTEAQNVAAANKTAASNQVSAVAALEQQAQAAQTNVQKLVATNAANQAAAKSELTAYEKQLAAFKAEDARVSKLIAARIAADKLAAARRAAAANAASGGSSGSSGSTSSWGFVRPSSGYISSPYGMRRDPINGSSSFHSGTDFAAGCGSPILAARAGRVSDRYYNSSYGNRLIIDHGTVNGVYLSTAYNHAQRYIVSVGASVGRGQVIGYMGTTGRSTGCHLHFQVYENGDLANPMRFL